MTPGERIHVATRKGLFTIERGASGWAIASTHFLGDNCSLVAHDPRPGPGSGASDGSLYAALDHGHFGVKLHRSTDRGASWDEVGVPVYPEKPAGYQPKTDPAEGTDYDWALKRIWAIEPAGADRPGQLWCGTLPGGLFHSADHGATWELNRALWDHPGREEWFGGGADVPAIHSVCVDPRNADHLVVGVSCGGAWVSEDGGASWNPGGHGMRADFMPPERQYDVNIQDPHLLVQCPADPDRLWVQHHNGIFRSNDRAKSWSEIEGVQPSAFGFAVAVHPAKPDTAWFVPAVKDETRIPAGGQVAVNRTTDAGGSFTTLRSGLPQHHAYDLTLRHALDIDASGDRLAFGSTTGSLWVTEDGGDSWQTVSNHLPPIHAVRFEKPAA